MLVFFLLIFNLYYERFNLWTMKNPSITVKCPLFSKVFLEVLGQGVSYSDDFSPAVFSSSKIL